MNIIYTPDAEFCGTDQFTYTITAEEHFATATVFMTVTCPGSSTTDVIESTTPESPEENRPIANDDFATTNRGKSVVIFVLSNDTVPEGKMLCHIFLLTKVILLY